MLLNLRVPTTGVLAVHSPGRLEANIVTDVTGRASFSEHTIYTNTFTHITEVGKLVKTLLLIHFNSYN